MERVKIIADLQIKNFILILRFRPVFYVGLGPFRAPKKKLAAKQLSQGPYYSKPRQNEILIS